MTTTISTSLLYKINTSMATTTFLSPTTTAATTTTTTSLPFQSLHLHSKLRFPNLPSSRKLKNTKLNVSSNPTTKLTTKQPQPQPQPTQETIFFDGGAHYGDLIANLLLGFTLVWLPLTLAAVSRAFTLRYRFSNLRVTVISGLTGEERSDFSYKVIKDVQVVPRFIGEWGDVVITLKDGTKVDLRSVPRFREIAKYCLSMAKDEGVAAKETPSLKPKGF